MTKLALKQIDWFRSRGYLLGQRKSKGIYYIVNSRGKELEFPSVWQAQQFVLKQ